MKSLQEIKVSPHLYDLEITSASNIAGYGKIRLVRWKGTVIFDDTTGWEHVSVSPKGKGIYPNWYELKQIKRIFWNDDEEVIQFFPKTSEHVNLMANCFHLWRNAEVEKLCETIGYRGV